MCKKKLITSLSALFVLGGLAPAFAQDANPSGLSVGKLPGKITASVDLPNPITKVIELEGREGIGFISQNGRFVIRGYAFDMWTGETLNTIGDFEKALTHFNIANLDLDPKDVDPIYFGSGPEKAFLFVDPLCPHCATLMQEIYSDPIYAQKYTFEIYTVPFLGDDSALAVSAISCASDRQAATRALMTKDRNWIASQAKQVEDCDPQPIMQRLILSQMLGVNGVPFLISPSGATSRGTPPNLYEFLAN